MGVGQSRYEPLPGGLALSGGLAQWYENTLYVSSMGQGIAAKTFEED